MAQGRDVLAPSRSPVGCAACVSSSRVARWTIRGGCRLTCRWPLAWPVVKADGSVLVHSDAGGDKLLMWIWISVPESAELRLMRHGWFTALHQLRRQVFHVGDSIRVGHCVDGIWVGFEVMVAGWTLSGERWRADAPPLVFLHSGVSDRRAWYAVVNQLEGTVDAVAFDQRGHGGSPLGTGLFRQVDDVVAVLDDQGIDVVLLVGNSIGGGCGSRPRVDRTRTSCGARAARTGISGAPPFEDDQLDPPTLVLSQQIDKTYEDGDEDERLRLETWLWLDGPAQPEGRVGGAARRLAEEMGKAITSDEELNGKSGLATWDRLEQIAAPTIIGIGEYDVPILNERCTRLADRLPNASLRVLNGTAHSPSMDAPDQVSALVREISQLPPNH